MSKRLVMAFKKSDGKKLNLSVANVRDDVTEAEIKQTMDMIVEKNFMKFEDANIEGAVEARIVETKTEKHDLVL